MTKQDILESHFSQIWKEWNELDDDAKVTILVDLYCSMDDAAKDEFLRNTDNG